MRQSVLILALCSACDSRVAGVSEPQTNQAALELGPMVAKVTVVSATGRPGTMGTRREEAIYTDLVLRIDAPIRNVSGETLNLSLLGGSVGDRAMHVSGQAELHAGDEAIVWVNDASAPKPFLEVLPVRDGRVYARDGRPLVAVQGGGLVFGGREQPARPPPVPLGTASGALLTPTLAVALTVDAAVEALGR